MKLFVALSFALISSFALAESKVTLFVTLSPAGSFQAVSKKVKGNLVKQGDNFTADKITVSIESFNTGIDLRDEHTWKHMNSSKHPKATLTDLKAQGGKATAMLEVNGEKRPVNITYTTKNDEVVAKFSVKASDFKMAKAEYLGVGVEDTINVETILPYKAK
ncbi:YceI family protein [Peredibacter starrii]|uniref:YceI family protein n=1 Tax=Peredibacter starrii TaxID=28202 RepID=A0AAX4HT45_9BACT|nr:YceI family protein [Peredibacter starrii]WPU66099.1 YceI family protein [Peredibacter starrii]